MSTGKYRKRKSAFKRLTRAQLLRYALFGYNWKEIAKRAGCSEYLVYRLKKEYALTDEELGRIQIAKRKLANLKANKERRKSE